MIRIEIDMPQTRPFLSIWIFDLSSLVYTQKITLTCTNNFHQFFFLNFQF